MYKNQRQTERTCLNLPVQMSFSSEITIQGELRDISLRSAFIKMKSSVYMETNDKIDFQIRSPFAGAENPIRGSAYISRISVGEGIAICFTKVDEGSSQYIQQLVNRQIGNTGF